MLTGSRCGPSFARLASIYWLLSYCCPCVCSCVRQHIHSSPPQIGHYHVPMTTLYFLFISVLSFRRENSNQRSVHFLQGFFFSNFHTGKQLNSFYFVFFLSIYFPPSSSPCPPRLPVLPFLHSQLSLLPAFFLYVLRRPTQFEPSAPAREEEKKFGTTLTRVNTAFTVLYALEFLLKFCAFGKVC